MNYSSCSLGVQRPLQKPRDRHVIGDFPEPSVNNFPQLFYMWYFIEQYKNQTRTPVPQDSESK